METGESADKAVQRELYEETGVKANNLRRVFFDDDVTENRQGIKRHYVMLLYAADYESGELRQTEGNDDEFEDVNWYTTDELRHIPLSPPLQKLLKQQGIL